MDERAEEKYSDSDIAVKAVTPLELWLSTNRLIERQNRAWSDFESLFGQLEDVNVEAEFFGENEGKGNFIWYLMCSNAWSSTDPVTKDKIKQALTWFLEKGLDWQVGLQESLLNGWSDSAVELCSLLPVKEKTVFFKKNGILSALVSKTSDESKISSMCALVCAQGANPWIGEVSDGGKQIVPVELAMKLGKWSVVKTLAEAGESDLAVTLQIVSCCALGEIEELQNNYTQSQLDSAYAYWSERRNEDIYSYVGDKIVESFSKAETSVSLEDYAKSKGIGADVSDHSKLAHDVLAFSIHEAIRNPSSSKSMKRWLNEFSRESWFTEYVSNLGLELLASGQSEISEYLLKFASENDPESVIIKASLICAMADKSDVELEALGEKIKGVEAQLLNKTALTLGSKRIAQNLLRAGLGPDVPIAKLAVGLKSAQSADSLVQDLAAEGLDRTAIDLLQKNSELSESQQSKECFKDLVTGTSGATGIEKIRLLSALSSTYDANLLVEGIKPALYYVLLNDWPLSGVAAEVKGALARSATDATISETFKICFGEREGKYASNACLALISQSRARLDEKMLSACLRTAIKEGDLTWVQTLFDAQVSMSSLTKEDALAASNFLNPDQYGQFINKMACETEDDQFYDMPIKVSAATIETLIEKGKTGSAMKLIAGTRLNSAEYSKISEAFAKNNAVAGSTLSAFLDKFLHGDYDSAESLLGSKNLLAAIEQYGLVGKLLKDSAVSTNKYALELLEKTGANMRKELSGIANEVWTVAFEKEDVSLARKLLGYNVSISQKIDDAERLWTMALLDNTSEFTSILDEAGIEPPLSVFAKIPQQAGYRKHFISTLLKRVAKRVDTLSQEDAKQVIEALRIHTGAIEYENFANLLGIALNTPNTKLLSEICSMQKRDYAWDRDRYAGDPLRISESMEAMAASNEARKLLFASAFATAVSMSETEALKEIDKLSERYPDENLPPESIQLLAKSNPSCVALVGKIWGKSALKGAFIETAKLFTNSKNKDAGELLISLADSGANPFDLVCAGQIKAGDCKDPRVIFLICESVEKQLMSNLSKGLPPAQQCQKYFDSVCEWLDASGTKISGEDKTALQQRIKHIKMSAEKNSPLSWAIELIKEDPEMLIKAHPVVKGDKQCVTEAVSQNGSLLEYASPELRADILICETAIKQSLANFKHVHPALVEELGLTEDNCAEKLKKPSLLNAFKLIAMSRAQDMAQQKARNSAERSEEQAQAKDERIVFTQALDMAADANLGDEESYALKIALSKARKLSNARANLTAYDLAESKKIIEQNIPLLLEKYARVESAEREKRSVELDGTPKQYLIKGLVSASERLTEIFERALNTAKRGVFVESEVLSYNVAGTSQIADEIAAGNPQQPRPKF